MKFTFFLTTFIISLKLLISRSIGPQESTASNDSVQLKHKLNCALENYSKIKFLIQRSLRRSQTITNELIKEHTSDLQNLHNEVKLITQKVLSESSLNEFQKKFITDRLEKIEVCPSIEEEKKKRISFCNLYLSQKYILYYNIKPNICKFEKNEESNSKFIELIVKNHSRNLNKEQTDYIEDLFKKNSENNKKCSHLLKRTLNNYQSCISGKMEFPEYYLKINLINEMPYYKKQLNVIPEELDGRIIRKKKNSIKEEPQVIEEIIQPEVKKEEKPVRVTGRILRKNKKNKEEGDKSEELSEIKIVGNQNEEE